MTLGERLKMYRRGKGLSQEKAAELLGVSRQAVTKWEAGQTTPSSDNLIALAKLYGVSLDELAAAQNSGGKAPGNSPRYNPVLRANLTKLAIMAQTVFLNTAIQEYAFRGTAFWVAFVLLPLLLSSAWMAFNLRYEKDKSQLKKNVRIELAYCLLQSAIALSGYYTKWYFPAAVSLIAVCLVYIIHVNPRYMNRQLVRSGK